MKASDHASAATKPYDQWRQYTYVCTSMYSTWQYVAFEKIVTYCVDVMAKESLVSSFWQFEPQIANCCVKYVIANACPSDKWTT